MQFSIFNFQSFLLLAVALSTTPAHAHKLHVFATADGSTIAGEVYAAGGAPIRNATLLVQGPNGEKLGQTKTDAEGKFHFDARQKIDHTFVLDDGSGHGARYTVPADEVSSVASAETPSAPVEEPQSAPKPRPENASKKPAASPTEIHTHGPADRHDDVELQLKAIHTQIVQLRRQIDAYEQRIRFHDILGGLGVIAGVTGLVYYFLGEGGRRKGEGGGKSTDPENL